MPVFDDVIPNAYNYATSGTYTAWMPLKVGTVNVMLATSGDKFGGSVGPAMMLSYAVNPGGAYTVVVGTAAAAQVLVGW